MKVGMYVNARETCSLPPRRRQQWLRFAHEGTCTHHLLAFHYRAVQRSTKTINTFEGGHPGEKSL